MNRGMTQDCIYGLYTAGRDSKCGIPHCCPGGSVTCAASTCTFLPNELEGFITIEELKAMTAEIDEVFAQTVMPTFPCLLGHFCLPFSPVCAMMYCANRRDRGIRAILEKYNTNLKERGLYWERQTHGLNPRAFLAYPFAVLKYNRAARERYLQTAPVHLRAPCPGSAPVQPVPLAVASPATAPVAMPVIPMSMDGAIDKL